MNHRALLAIADPHLLREITALLEEGGAVTVTGTADSAATLIDMLTTAEADVVLLHEGLGPLPVVDLARELDLRFPDVGLVLIARDTSPELLRAALETGVRGIIAIPPSLDEVQARTVAAAEWARSIRTRLGGETEEVAERVGGVMVALAGAKGGVGTSTAALHLALEAALAGGDASVCLIDLDLQAGDIPNLLDLSHRRTVLDLLPVAEDLTARHLAECLYIHPSGLRVLLGPGDGERADEVTAEAARLILGGIRSRFDIVVVDCGSSVTEAAAVAVELADRAVVVATADVPALRGANRLLSLWERLRVRKPEDAVVVLTRVSRRSEVQPELARRSLASTLTATALPADFFALQEAASTGDPGRLGEGALAQAVADLAVELSLTPTARARSRNRRRRRPGGRGGRGGRSQRGTPGIVPPAGGREGGQGGQVAIETVGLSLLILTVIGLCWQIVLAAYSGVLAGHSAREAARQLAVHNGGDGARAAALGELPGAWRDGATVDVGADSVTVTVHVPLLFPGVASDLTVSSRSGTVVEPGP